MLRPAIRDAVRDGRNLLDLAMSCHLLEKFSDGGVRALTDGSRRIISPAERFECVQQDCKLEIVERYCLVGHLICACEDAVGQGWEGLVDVAHRPDESLPEMKVEWGSSASVGRKPHLVDRREDRAHDTCIDRNSHHMHAEYR